MSSARASHPGQLVIAGDCTHERHVGAGDASRAKATLGPAGHQPAREVGMVSTYWVVQLHQNLMSQKVILVSGWDYFYVGSTNFKKNFT